jgi:hypothetical protein
VEYFPYPDILPPDYYDYYGLPQYPIYGSASFAPSAITVAAGQSYDLYISFTPPTLTSAQILKTPVFSGIIEISS